MKPQYYESHPGDSRVTGPYDIACTVSARYGTGGNNTPLVLIKKDSNKKYWMTDQGGQMCRWRNINVAYTLHWNDYKDLPAILLKKEK